ncbi:hypothetical protein [Streptomyces sp. NPDC001388]|uniref:hypothetical protein n=1 Tax=Streptomyces sp. NPDC001388 TaxID=3364568 RepID=UPI00369F100C
MAKEIRFPPAPPVTVLLDPGDDVAVAWAALAAHQPGGDCITIHPSPRMHTTTLAFDILAGLGKPPALPGNWAGAGPAAWNVVGAWILTRPVSRLILLRAHLLDATCWKDLLALRHRTGLHLMIVCHQPTMPTVMCTALQETEHACIPAHSPYATRLLTPLPAAPPHDIPIAEGRWVTLPSLAYLDYHPNADFPPCRCTPRYTGHRTARHRSIALPEPSAHALTQITHRLATRTAHPQLAAALATAIVTAAPAKQLAAVHIDHLNADATALTLHDRHGARPLELPLVA